MSLSGTNPKRQMMINMMYLVLTALLALNVSAEILKAFALVNGTLQDANKNTADKTAVTYTGLDHALITMRARALPWVEKAKKSRELSQKMYGYLEGIKQNMAVKAGGWTDESHTTVTKKDNLDIGTRWFVEDGHGKKLKDSLDAYETQMEALAKNQRQVHIRTDVPKQKDGHTKDWPEYYFGMVPVVADITEITQLQNQVKSAESEMASYCLQQVTAETQNVDAFVPVISAPKAVIPSGERYTADVFLGAIDWSQKPKITVNGKNLDVKDGKATYEAMASGAGDQKVNVQITVRDNVTGRDTTYQATSEYSVFSAAAVISAEKMNVVWIGLENPIAVTVPGYAPNTVSGQIDGGGKWAPKSNGHYALTPDGHQHFITVSAYVKGGNGTKKVGETKYQVKSVPNPIVMLGVTQPGVVSAGELKTANFIQANMSGFVFEGVSAKILDGNFAVTKRNSAPVTYSFSGKAVNSNIRSALNGLKKGDMVTLYDVRVQCIDGQIKSLSSTYIIKQ